MKKAFLVIVSVLCIASQANAELHYDTKAKAYVPDIMTDGGHAEHWFAEPPKNCYLYGDVIGIASYKGKPDSEQPFLAVRANPSWPKDSAYEIDRLFDGDVVCVIGRSGEWFQIEYIRKDAAQIGWAHSRYLHLRGATGPYEIE